jgi:hypothetical protein
LHRTSTALFGSTRQYGTKLSAWQVAILPVIDPRLLSPHFMAPERDVQLQLAPMS